MQTGQSPRCERKREVQRQQGNLAQCAGNPKTSRSGHGGADSRLSVGAAIGEPARSRARAAAHNCHPGPRQYSKLSRTGALPGDALAHFAVPALSPSRLRLSSPAPSCVPAPRRTLVASQQNDKYKHIIVLIVSNRRARPD